ncbi:MAG: hypothetical protein L3K13_05740 [Thermoplasmata archaeon]|nr:hypothetical protein [Thermoplasmata archaeon]
MGPHKLFDDEDEVGLFYEFVTNPPAGTVFSAESPHVSNRKIDNVRVVFDARSFAPMMGN